jgi:hypothetical protein
MSPVETVLTHFNDMDEYKVETDQQGTDEYR